MAKKLDVSAVKEVSKVVPQRKAVAYVGGGKRPAKK